MWVYCSKIYNSNVGESSPQWRNYGWGGMVRMSDHPPASKSNNMLPYH